MNTSKMFRSLLALLFLVAVVPAALGAASDSIRVEQGLVSGTPGTHPDVRVYRGIPFAAPPVGELRWKAPQPPASWQGTREAKDFANACPQTPYPSGSLYQSKLPSMSEDCLYLNVWTAAKSAAEHRPVMVWIHGGGFTRGSAASTAYDGEVLSRKGVVVVTINYRLGVFGFLAHPELTAESGHHASGNYALLDQIAALQWVRKNIAAFGGDPDRVTIFGESAGSWAVNALMASPLAKGLFHRAIGESGASFSPMRTLAESEKAGEKFAAALGVTQDTLKALRAKSTDEILKAGDAPTVRPAVDGWVLPQDIYTIFAQGKQNDVPLLIGNNADEGTSLAPQGASIKAAAYVDGVRQRYGSAADQFLKIYPAGNDEEAVASFYSAYRDQVFGWEMRTWARQQTRTGHSPAYVYYFSRRPPGPQSQKLRAFHAADVAYVFGTFFWSFPWEETDHKLSDSITSYWVNFATSGNPNGEGLPQWPAYGVQSDQVLELGDRIVTRSGVNKAGLDFFDGYYQSLRSPQTGRAAAAK
ncbi:MAG TPA: carboxylesterase/lipase family protein [Verrucomicrobiae bacterium]|jgi:para-nitrobenzyl esterase|nr:carboxylesterase/lipase family protein [Verrucomicrobiae bacterium]